MKSMTFKSLALGLTLCVSGLAFAAGQEASEKTKAPEDKGKELFETTCSGCHDLDLTIGLRQTKDEWTGLVQRMVDRGAYLSKEQFPVLIDYLAKTYPKK